MDWIDPTDPTEKETEDSDDSDTPHEIRADDEPGWSEPMCILAFNTIKRTDNHTDGPFFTRLLREVNLMQKFSSAKAKADYLAMIAYASDVLSTSLPKATDKKVWLVMRCPYLNTLFRTAVATGLDLGYSGPLGGFADYVAAFKEQVSTFLERRPFKLETTMDWASPGMRAAAAELARTIVKTGKAVARHQNSFFAHHLHCFLDANFPDALDSEILDIAKCEEFADAFSPWFYKQTGSISEDDAILLFLGEESQHVVKLEALAVEAAQVALACATKEREAKAEAAWLRRRDEQKMKRFKGKGKPKSREERQKFEAFQSYMVKTVRGEKAELRACDLRLAQRRAKVIEVLERERKTEQTEMAEMTAHEFAQRAISLGIEQYAKDCRVAEAAEAHAARLAEHAVAETAKHAEESARRREVRTAAKAAKEAREAREAAEEEARQRAHSVAASARAGSSTVAVEDAGESSKAKQKGQKQIAIEEARVAHGARKEMEREQLARTAAELEKRAKNLAIGDSLCWG